MGAWVWGEVAEKRVRAPPPPCRAPGLPLHAALPVARRLPAPPPSPLRPPHSLPPFFSFLCRWRPPAWPPR